MQSIISEVIPLALSMQATYSCVISLSAAASAGVLNKSPKTIGIAALAWRVAARARNFRPVVILIISLRDWRPASLVVIGRALHVGRGRVGPFRGWERLSTRERGRRRAGRGAAQAAHRMVPIRGPSLSDRSWPGSVTVGPERRARRRHRGRVGGRGEGRDGNQGGQGESGDKRFHDTSPCLDDLSSFCASASDRSAGACGREYGHPRAAAP